MLWDICTRPMRHIVIVIIIALSVNPIRFTLFSQSGMSKTFAYWVVQQNERWKNYSLILRNFIQHIYDKFNCHVLNTNALLSFCSFYFFLKQCAIKKALLLNIPCHIWCSIFKILSFCKILIQQLFAGKRLQPICGKEMNQGAVSIRKTVLPGMTIPMLKIRRPNGRLIFNMGIPIPGKTVFYIEMGPRFSKGHFLSSELKFTPHQITGSYLPQIMFYCLFGAKSPSQQMQIYHIHNPTKGYLLKHPSKSIFL